MWQMMGERRRAQGDEAAEGGALVVAGRVVVVVVEAGLADAHHPRGARPALQLVPGLGGHGATSWGWMPTEA
jgi:hypothetical protein